MEQNALRFLRTSDPELILSWTPRQYLNFMHGAEQGRVDEYELQMFNAKSSAYFANAKKPKDEKIFNAKKIRKDIDQRYEDDKVRTVGSVDEDISKNMENERLRRRLRRQKSDLKAWAKEHFSKRKEEA